MYAYRINLLKMINSNLPVFVCLCVLGFLTGVCAQDSCVSPLRPTGNLREVVLGRCTLYQESVNPAAFCKKSIIALPPVVRRDARQTQTRFDPRNCTEVWEKFSAAFLYQSRCNVPEDRYDDYSRMTHHPVPRDTALFWENVFPFVHRFSNHGAKYFTLSDTLTGYVGNGLQWCGDPDTGMSESPAECPEWEPTPDCPQSAQRAFWIAASHSFGRRATGHVHIMMNASSEPIYASTTYFALYELPFIQSNVTKATMLLVSENPGRDACSDQSLKELENIFESRGIEYACVQNRRDVARLLCHDDPGSRVCSVLELEPEACGTSATTASSLITFALFFVTSAIIM